MKVETGRERDVVERLQRITSLEEIHFLFGEFDYLLTIHATDVTTLSRLITERVRKIPGIERTITLLEAPL